VDGSNAVVGGTSAVVPLLAGVVALLNQVLTGLVGFLNPDLYQKLAISPGAFRDITRGNNAIYQARQGWGFCTVWGSPVGAAI
jgi:kumamolisin